MRAGLYALAIPLALCACESRIGKATREYKMAKAAGVSASELCARGAAVTEAYLQAGNEEYYRSQKVSSDIDCQSAQFDERNGVVRGPDGNIIEPERMDLTENIASLVAVHEPQKPKVQPTPEPTYDNPDDPPDGAPYDNSVQ